MRCRIRNADGRYCNFVNNRERFTGLVEIAEDIELDC